jgi:hypothetical protein
LIIEARSRSAQVRPFRCIYPRYPRFHAFSSRIKRDGKGWFLCQKASRNGKKLLNATLLWIIWPIGETPARDRAI